MGLVRRRVSGGYFGGSRLIVPGQGVYSIKKYNNFIGKSGIPKENYNDIPVLTPTPTPTPTVTNTPTPTVTNTPTPTVTNTPIPSNTPTPTPTPTPKDVILINPIITRDDEYITVGNNEYLEFVDPI